MPDLRSAGRVWRYPLLLALSEAVGLAAALLGGPGWGWASWVGLAAPLAVVLVRLTIRSRSHSRP